VRLQLICCKFPSKLAEDLEKLAKAKGMTVSELVRKAVADLIIRELAPREVEES